MISDGLDRQPSGNLEWNEVRTYYIEWVLELVCSRLLTTKDFERFIFLITGYDLYTDFRRIKTPFKSNPVDKIIKIMISS